VRVEDTEGLLARSRALIAAGKALAAVPLLQELAQRPDCPRAAVLQLADLEIQTGRAESARQRLTLPAFAVDQESEFLLARAEAATGRHESALQRLLTLKRQLPAPSAQLQLAIGNTLILLRRDREAADALQLAIDVQPANKPAHLSLIVALNRMGEAARALEAAERAVATVQSSPKLWETLAALQAQNNRIDEALASFRKAVQLGPQSPSAWLALGHFHAENWQFKDAREALLKAAALQPGDASTEAILAFVEQELGNTAGALAALGRARNSGKGNDLRIAVADALLLPQICSSKEDMASWRIRYADRLAKLAAPERQAEFDADQVLGIEKSNFLLAYQGENDLPLQRTYSAFLGRLIERTAPGLRMSRTNRFNGDRRLKVGFAGSLFRTCTAGLYFERWVTGLDSQRFEKFVYYTGPAQDALTARVAASCDHFAHLRMSAADTAARIAGDDLDVLVYPEVGMDSMTYALAAMRLAPVQCAGWGHPVTTGSDMIDHFISCEAMEPENAREHYCEPLILLPGIGVDYAMPQVPTTADRAKFGLPTDKHLYFCPQSLFKIHPDMDDIVAALLHDDPDGVLIMFQGASMEITDAFARRLGARLESHGVQPRGQLKFLPRMDTPMFRAALCCADVVLDTVHWSGGNTSLDAFACGVPVVTLPGEFMRGRQTMAMLRMMGLEDLIATSAGDYVRVARRLASDSNWSGEVRRTISSARSALFNRPENVSALETALQEIARTK
jgi:protein O-GlcNAc transferase